MPAPPKLRDELRFTLVGDPVAEVLIEDPATGDFLRTDRVTAAFARLLDGRRSPEQAFDRLRRDLGADALGESDAVAVLEELRVNGLLEAEPGSPTRVLQKRQIGAISQRVRLGSFDRFFASVLPYQKWLYSPLGWLGWGILLVVAIAALAGRWGSFTAELGHMFSIHAILWFWLAWMASKAWHEVQHALVARHYGVEVREVGLLFVMFFPLGAYVDVTGTWRLQSIWKRLHITVAGIVGDLGLGAIAVLLWAQSPPGEWQAFLQALILATMVSTLIFNANPLMRFDGYHALVDVLRLPNLYQRGMVEVRTQILKLLTGQRRTSAETPAVSVYGWLSLGWRLMVGVTLTIAASHVAFGFGLALAAIVAWQMAATPLWRTAKSVWLLGPQARWVASARVAGAGALLALLWFLPVPMRIASPALVEFRDSTEVRAGSSGTVLVVKMLGGDQVRAGSTLVQLENRKLMAERAEKAAGLAKLRVEMSAAAAVAELRDAQDSAEKIQTAKAELAELDRQLAELTITAPRDGMVVEHDLHELQSRWLERGDQILELADPAEIEIRAWMVPQDVEWLPEAGEMRFEPSIFGASPVPVRVERLEPIASINLPPDGVTARGGGSIAIDTRGREPKLLSPRVLATYLPLETARPLLAGVPGRLVSGLIWRQAGDLAWRWLSSLSLPRPSS